jgi:hypothetical protein
VLAVQARPMPPRSAEVPKPEGVAGATTSDTTSVSTTMSLPLEAAFLVPVRTIRSLCRPSGRPVRRKTDFWNCVAGE